MRLTLDLTHVVNGSRLVEPVDWLALYSMKVYHLLKILLDQYSNSAIVLYTYVAISTIIK